MKKKAITLSINLITIFIISIVVFALGIFAVRYFITSARELEEEVSISVERQINQLLVSSNEKVVLPEFRKTLHQGQRYSFALGIKNYLEQTADFNVNMRFSYAMTTKDESLYSPNIDMSRWIFESQGPFRLGDNEKKIISMPVHTIGSEPGITYVFEVEVRCNKNIELCNPYGYKQKIFVDVIK